MVHSLPGAGIEASGGDRDEPVDVTVDCNEDNERDEDHEDKVGNENVVSAVAEAFSHFCWANRDFASRLVTVISKHCLLVTTIAGHWIALAGKVEHSSAVHCEASLKLVKPGNVENHSEENHREDVEVAGVSQHSASQI